MVIKRFKAESFRNINYCDIELSEKVNLFVGNNAQGKTNIVEGIYYFSRGRSFRAAEERELVKCGSDGFRIYIEYEDKKGKNSIEYASFGRERLRKKNGYKLKNNAEMLGNFVSVLFSPDDLGLVKEGPEKRRQFLNIGISQWEPSYVAYYSDFKKSLENRNKLLKNASKGINIDENELYSWSLTMAEHASYINLMRREYIEKICKYASKNVKELSLGKEELSMIYKSDIEENFTSIEQIKNRFIEKLTQNNEKEKTVGNTLYGPQRDDIDIYLSGLLARSYASQGQQRSIVLGMKLAEGEVIKEKIGEYPVFLLDDVLSELDEVRREYVIRGISDKQIIITSCFEENLNLRADRIISVSGGEYVSSHR